MAERLVAADASPLIGLASAGAFELLRMLFRQVTVTGAVRDEVLAGGDLPGSREISRAIEEGWIKVETADPDPGKFADLGAGEASTLALARAYPDQCLVLMDEPLGRVHARAHGLAVTGLACVLLAAKRAGFIPTISPLFERLEGSSFRLSQEVIRTILEQAGETPAPPEE